MIGLLLLGFAAIAAGTWRQSRLLFGAVPPPRVRLASLAGGYALIAAALAVAVRRPDPAREMVAWLGAMTLAALVVVGFCWARGRLSD